ncbi:4-coumarate-CoA ligase 1 [Fusarium proliferatum]|nr:4-coumarate-CoA ligase 1 [Fusarium proliferatum]
MQPIQPPQNCSIEEFLLEEKYGRHAIQASLNPFTCGLTSQTRTTVEVKQLVTELAQGLGDKLGWHAIPSDQLERVVYRYGATCVGDSSFIRDCDPSQQPFICDRVILATCLVKCKGHLHLSSASPDGAQGYSRDKDSRQPCIYHRTNGNDAKDRPFATLQICSGLSKSGEGSAPCGPVEMARFPSEPGAASFLSLLQWDIWLTVAKYDLSSSVEMFIGAAPLGPEILVKTRKLFPYWKVLQGYGLTEAGAVVSLSRRDDIWLGSSGVPLDGIECRLLSDDGKELKDLGHPGELVIRSPALASGYFCNEEATQETFHNGWLRTGDLALLKRSSKGNLHLFIVDRIKDLIKGMQVSPTELEAHLLLHHGVEEAAVVGIDDPVAGEVPKAFIVRSTSSQAQSTQDLSSSIKKHVEENKAKYKWLRGGIEFVQELPKTPSGKITRRALRDAARRKAKSVKTGSHL